MVWYVQWVAELIAMTMQLWKAFSIHWKSNWFMMRTTRRVSRHKKVCLSTLSVITTQNVGILPLATKYLCEWCHGKCNLNPCPFFRGKIIRRFLPKGTDLTKVSRKTIRTIEERLNLRPRKCLGYKTPYEVYNDLGGALKHWMWGMFVQLFLLGVQRSPLYNSSFTICDNLLPF